MVTWYCFALTIYLCHFIAISEFKLELPSGNAQIGDKSTIFVSLQHWNLTDGHLFYATSTCGHHFESICNFFVLILNLPLQNRLCADPKPAFSFWINISTVLEVRCDCQGLGLVARIEASVSIWYYAVLCKTCLDTKPVLYQNRFCSLRVVWKRL